MKTKKETAPQQTPLVSIERRRGRTYVVLSDYLADLPDNERTRVACEAVDKLMGMIRQMCIKGSDLETTPYWDLL